jgi:phage-related protein
VLYCHKKKSKHGIQLPKHEREIIEKRLKDALIDGMGRPRGPT